LIVSRPSGSCAYFGLEDADAELQVPLHRASADRSFVLCGRRDSHRRAHLHEHAGCLRDTTAGTDGAQPGDVESAAV